MMNMSLFETLLLGRKPALSRYKVFSYSLVIRTGKVIFLYNVSRGYKM